MKRSEYDRPRHPIGTSVPVQDTWRCAKCGVVRGLRAGWHWVGTGKARRRICKPCYELRTMNIDRFDWEQSCQDHWDSEE